MAGVTFDGCTLVIVAAVHTTLADMTFMNMHASNRGLRIVVHGVVTVMLNTQHSATHIDGQHRSETHLDGYTQHYDTVPDSATPSTVT